jgi:hypothetical protein
MTLIAIDPHDIPRIVGREEKAADHPVGEQSAAFGYPSLVSDVVRSLSPPSVQGDSALPDWSRDSDLKREAAVPVDRCVGPSNASRVP